MISDLEHLADLPTRCQIFGNSDRDIWWRPGDNQATYGTRRSLETYEGQKELIDVPL